MDALIQEDNITVWFGGSYDEHWSADYRLTVSYRDRTPCTGRVTEGGFQPDGSLPELPLAREYFDAACAVQYSVRKTGALGLGKDKLHEVFSCHNPVAPYELLRALLDDEGFEFEAAVKTVARCCPEKSEGVSETELCKLNPRTAHLVHILDTALAVRVIAVHDSRSLAYRAPVGAVETGSSVRLRCAVLGGGVTECVCELYGDSFGAEYDMHREDGAFSVDITLLDVPAALWYSFRLKTPGGERWLCPGEDGFYGEVCPSRLGGFRLTVFMRGFNTPDWFKGAVMYQIFPDRFAFSDDDTARRGVEYHRAMGQTPELHQSPDEPVRYTAREFERDYEPDDFYGGTLRGIRERLGYIKALGVSVIYLNPIVEARSNHRYDTSDYLRVDPILGTDEDFTEMCDVAAALGMRVILDGVFSHTGADSVYFNRRGRYPGLGACQGEGSPYYNWYSFSEFPSKYKCWWNFPDLPEVDEENPAWQNFVVTGRDSVVKTWLRRGSGGWRIDVADELPDDVLSLIRACAKEERPDAVILGEVWEDAVLKESYGGRRNYALGYSLDSVMNYPLRDAVLGFMHGRMDALSLRDFLDGQRLNYPAPMYNCLMNLMGSHDVERLRTNLCTDADVKALPRQEQADFAPDEAAIAKAARLERLCAVIQFSLPGVPSVYYGDEVGMSGCRDPFNRLPYRVCPHSPLEFYQKLGGIRREHHVMSTGCAEFSACGPDVLIIRRLGGGETVTVINRAEGERPVFLTAGGKDLLTGGQYGASFVLPPYSAVILERT